MDVRVGDTLVMKKKHPCGCDSFTVLRIGMDFKIRCLGCDREVMVPRSKIEKNIILVRAQRSLGLHIQITFPSDFIGSLELLNMRETMIILVFQNCFFYNRK